MTERRMMLWLAGGALGHLILAGVATYLMYGWPDAAVPRGLIVSASAVLLASCAALFTVALRRSWRAWYWWGHLSACAAGAANAVIAGYLLVLFATAGGGGYHYYFPLIHAGAAVNCSLAVRMGTSVPIGTGEYKHYLISMGRVVAPVFMVLGILSAALAVVVTETGSVVYAFALSSVSFVFLQLHVLHAVFVADCKVA